MQTRKQEQLSIDFDGFINDAVERRICVKNLCTTCGASEFKNGLELLITQSALEGSAEEVLAVALSGASKPEKLSRSYFAAIRLVILFLWNSGFSRSRLEEILNETWAGDVLNLMKKHYEERQLAHFKHVANQEKQVEAKKLKLKEKVQANLERVKSKLERDRLFFLSA